MSFAYGVRDLKGIEVPNDVTTQIRFYWRPVTDNVIIFFAQALMKFTNVWVPVDCKITVISGGLRSCPYNEDRGWDSVHKVIRHNCNRDEDRDLVIQLECRDHRSFQVFTEDQLSNLKDTATAENVEHAAGSN